MAVAGLHLGLRGREGQSLSVHDVKKRVTGCDQDVDSHTKLKIVDEDCAKPPGKIIIQWSLSICGVLNPGIF